jgi:hypothetical protein
MFVLRRRLQIPYGKIHEKASFASVTVIGPAANEANEVDGFRVARDRGVVWRIHSESQADFSILVDCAGGPRAFAEAHYP